MTSDKGLEMYGGKGNCSVIDENRIQKYKDK